MNYFNQDCKFKYTFREYQKRALDEIHNYMQDDKINIVAAPGAGKTVLALQLMIELGKPTLICVPSIALREQWIQRLKSDFYHINENMISDDLLNPTIVTICTYQAIYSALNPKKKSKLEEIQDTNDSQKSLSVFKLLETHKVSTIILDEAHHLKQAWWRALVKLLKNLENIKTISLTATPPYDAVNSKWKNYIEICGDIDVEITIPELVQKGDLCPHQDYIYLNYPTKEEIREIEKQRENIKLLCSKICNDTKFITAISLNPGLSCLEDKIDLFLENFNYYLSILSFLKFKQINFISNQFNINHKKIPNFNMRQLEILLDGCLFLDKNSYINFNETFKEIKKELNQIGIIEESHVHLGYGKEIKKIIRQNHGKLNSINQIIEHEIGIMNHSLKLVIIADYIREDIYNVEEFVEIKTIGVIPIFENIRRNIKNSVNAIVLTGKIVIIPTILREELLHICKSEEVDSSLISIQDLEYDFDYSKVIFSGISRKKMVHLITKLFESTNVQVLIATSALIGEGWDAPFVNSLIIASSAGSFVLSNQMRGRAIRINKLDENKTSNIWHLACVEQGECENSFILGDDFEILNRRFSAFDGIFLDTNKIDCGIDRLGFNNEILDITKEQIDVINQKMVAKAVNRSEMVERWRQSLINYVPIKKYRMSIDDSSINRRARYIIIHNNNKGLMKYISKAYRKMIDINNLLTIKKISKATIDTLYKMNIFPKAYMFSIKKDVSDIVFYLEDSSIKNNSIFKECIREFLGEINNPRYVIKIRNIYFNVPSIIAKRRESVEIFRRNIEKRFITRTTILYTKTPENKIKLLQIKLDNIRERG